MGLLFFAYADTGIRYSYLNYANAIFFTDKTCVDADRTIFRRKFHRIT
jgi:hypothetical protein